MHTASQLCDVLWPVADFIQGGGVPCQCLQVSCMRGLLLMLCKLEYAVFLSLHYLSRPRTCVVLERSAVHTFARNCGGAPTSADLKPNICWNWNVLETAGNSFLGIMGLLWQAVLVTLVTCWSQSICFPPPFLPGDFPQLCCYVNSGTFALQTWRTVLRQPQFFSPLFFFTAIWWAKFFSFVSLNRAFCKWLWASCCCHCSHELMQKSQPADCSFVQVLCAVCASSVCSCSLAVDGMNIYARIRKHSFMQDCCLHAQCLGTLSWYRG